jgi:hypothetical protein
MTVPTVKRFLFAVFCIQLCLVENSYSQEQLSPDDIEFSKTWLVQVQQRNSNDDLIAAALVAQGQDPSLAAQFIDKATSTMPPSSLLLSTTVYHCIAGGPSNLCKDNSLYENLIQLEPDNLEPYLYYMRRLLDTGEEERALNVLKQGIDVARHDDYYFDKVRLVRDKFIAAGYPEAQAFVPAMLYADAVAYYAFYARMLADCPKLSVANVDWKQACLFLGARMGNSSRGWMASVFGNSIMRDVLIAVGADQEVIDLIIERREWDNKVRIIAGEKLDWWNDTLDQPETFKQDLMTIPEREAILRALLRTQ